MQKGINPLDRFQSLHDHVHLPKIVFLCFAAESPRAEVREAKRLVDPIPQERTLSKKVESAPYHLITNVMVASAALFKA
jgi:hypothetical protein